MQKGFPEIIMRALEHFQIPPVRQLFQMQSKHVNALSRFHLRELKLLGNFFNIFLSYNSTNAYGLFNDIL